MDALLDEFYRLLHQGPKFPFAGLVAWGHDFDDAYDVAMPMMYDNLIRSFRVNIDLIPLDQSCSRRCQCHGQAAP
jgi:hypothetical protein